MAYAAPDVKAPVPVPVERKRNAEADPAVLYSGYYSYENDGSNYVQPDPTGAYYGYVAQPYYNQGRYYPSPSYGKGYWKRDTEHAVTGGKAPRFPKVYAAPGAYRFWKRNADPMNLHRPKVYAVTGGKKHRKILKE